MGWSPPAHPNLTWALPAGEEGFGAVWDMRGSRLGYGFGSGIGGYLFRDLE